MEVVDTSVDYGDDDLGRAFGVCPGLYRPDAINRIVHPPLLAPQRVAGSAAGAVDVVRLGERDPRVALQGGHRCRYVGRGGKQRGIKGQRLFRRQPEFPVVSSQSLHGRGRPHPFFELDDYFTGHVVSRRFGAQSYFLSVRPGSRGRQG
ncbi:MAG: hypothetical protein DDT20_01874 [Firmicutes bacterium]|nr:hypothetical protein [Bacillota bacterium]